MTIYTAPDPERLAKLVTELREKAGWSQRELARRAKVNFATIQKIENAETRSPGLDVLTRVSMALNVSILKLIEAYGGEMLRTPKDFGVTNEINYAVAQFLDNLPSEVVDRRLYDRLREMGDEQIIDVLRTRFPDIVQRNRFIKEVLDD